MDNGRLSFEHPLLTLRSLFLTWLSDYDRFSIQQLFSFALFSPSPFLLPQTNYTHSPCRTKAEITLTFTSHENALTPTWSSRLRIMPVSKLMFPMSTLSLVWQLGNPLLTASEDTSDSSRRETWL